MPESGPPRFNNNRGSSPEEPPSIPPSPSTGPARDPRLSEAAPPGGVGGPVAPQPPASPPSQAQPGAPLNPPPTPAPSTQQPQTTPTGSGSSSVLPLIGLGLGLLVLLGGCVAIGRAVSGFGHFEVGECVVVEQQLFDHDLEAESCTTPSPLFGGIELYQVVDVIDGYRSNCRNYGLGSIEFSHEPHDKTYCLDRIIN